MAKRGGGGAEPRGASAGKRARRAPERRRRRGEDENADVSDDGKAPEKKRRSSVPGGKTTKKSVRGGEKPSVEKGAKKTARKAKKTSDVAIKEENTEQEIEHLLSLEGKASAPDVTVIEDSSVEEMEDSDEEWEDVEELNEPSLELLQASTSADPEPSAKPVEIEIETAEAAKARMRREKRKAEFAAYLRRMMNRFTKELREDTHKVHLLCLLANGIFRSNTCNSPDLQAVALSMVPAKFANVPAARVDVVYLTTLVKWFTSTFTLNPEMSLDEKEPLSSTLERRFGVYGVRDGEEMVHLFLILLRTLQLLSRLVLSLHPIPLKEPPAKAKRSSSTKSASKRTKKSSKPRRPSKAKSEAKSKKRKVLKQEEEVFEEDDEEEIPAAATTSRKEANKTKKRVKKEEPESDEESKPMSRPKNQLRRKAASKVSYKEESESGADSSGSEFSCSDSEEDSDLSDWGESAEKNATKKAMSRSNSGEAPSKSPGQPKAKSSPKENNNSTEPARRGKIISTDDEDDDDDVVEVPLSPKGNDQWVEVYLEKEEKWVCVDCIHGMVNKPSTCFKAATKPFMYVVGIDNSGHVNDVTRRYDPEWMTSTRKRRIDQEWWEETLRPFRNPNMKLEDREEAEFEAKLLDQPLPTSITEYKNHPLYALKRHLLKYESIYPESAAILGYCRGEAVYSRSCVHTLHSKDTWLKDARVVRLGEVPYKMVKGHSNRARKARMADPEKRDSNDLALYGLWQTEEYQPPVAVDGKVPRNEFGNVYLFKPCMLPIGCVHMQVPNLHRVARKLDIDCVQAITGFDFHGGYSHPVTDGYIVCEEHKDILLGAWENEQVEIERRQKEKREKRALGNWKLLIKGLLIRERLKARYGKDADHSHAAFGEGGFSSDEEEKPATETPAQDTAVSWPQNRQAEELQEGKAKRKSKREKKGEEKHLFPFEKL